MTDLGFDIHEVLKRLPHRFPFLLVDRILDYTPGESLVALKNVTMNEPFFTGHFPGRPVMPGVLIVESLAQACAILVFKTHDFEPNNNPNTVFYFAGLENCRFKRVVVPGDQLHLHVKLEKQKKDVWKFTTHAEVDGEIACTADITSLTKNFQARN
jgi:3-hydroxyacyl-[acyl-carrier-protein] dehydratase